MAAAIFAGSISIVPILPVVLVGAGIYFLATAFLRNRALRVSGPARWYIAFMVVGFAYAAIIGVEISLTLGLEALGATGRRSPDISKLETLGYRPRVPLERGREVTAEWYCRAAKGSANGANQ